MNAVSWYLQDKKSNSLQRVNGDKIFERFYDCTNRVERERGKWEGEDS